MSKLYLIRHAQASFLANDYDNLSDHGHAQSRILGEYFVKKNIQFDKVFIGPLRRHHQTYDWVRKAYEGKEIDFPEAIKIEELKEYEGMDSMENARELLSEHHPRFHQWFEEMDRHPSHRTKMKMVGDYLQMWATDSLGFESPAGTQTFADFRKTAEIGLQKVLAGNENGKTIVAFSSGGCISAMIADIAGIEDPAKAIGLNLVMLNTAISEVLFSGNRMSLRTFNSLSHLDEEMITTI